MTWEGRVAQCFAWQSQIGQTPVSLTEGSPEDGGNVKDLSLRL